MSGIKASLVDLKAELKNEEMKEEDRRDWSEENPSPQRSQMYPQFYDYHKICDCEIIPN